MVWVSGLFVMNETGIVSHKHLKFKMDTMLKIYILSKKKYECEIHIGLFQGFI